MNPLLRIHRNARADVERWLSTHRAGTSFNRGLLKVYFNAQFSRLAKPEALLPPVTQFSGIEPPVFAWEFDRNWWMVFTVQRKGW